VRPNKTANILTTQRASLTLDPAGNIFVC